MAEEPKKVEKTKATQNTAKATEPKPTLNLWAEYGQLQVEREKAQNAFKAITERMIELYQQIQEFER